MHYWFNGWHMIWMTASWLAGIGLLFVLIGLLAAAINGRPTTEDSPEEILRRRYAAGEIETGEYEQRLEELRKTKNAA
jgi:uncharacterized membrane protein